MANRGKMPLKERAKQFMPFAALKGLPEALAEVEKITVPRADLSEEQAAVLSETLNRTQKGDVVTAEYYEDGAYHLLVGEITRKEDGFFLLGEKKIFYGDLKNLRIE